MKLPRIDKGPELKLPRLSKPNLRGGGEKAGRVSASAGAPKPTKRKGPPLGERVPAPVADLVRDLRDRRLLIPAIALIVALAAVPLLLARPDEDPVLPAVVPVAADADAVAPAVLVDTAGVRDYEKRLASLKSRNPFDAPASVNLDASAENTLTEDVPISEDGGTNLGTGSEIGNSFPAAPELPSTGTPVDSAPVDTSDPGSEADDAGDGGGGNNGDSGDNGNGGDNDTKPEIRYITERISYEVGVSVGEQGEPLTQRGDLDLFQVLPSDNAPAAAFIGTDESGKRAAFLISSDVTRVSGEQSCFPSPDECQWAFLDPQSTMNLTYQPEDEAVAREFELRVDAIERVKERVKG